MIHFQEWNDRSVFPHILASLDELLEDQNCWACARRLLTAPSAPPKKGRKRLGPPKKGKGSKIMLIVDAQGLPLAVHTSSASPADVTLVHDTLDAWSGLDFPERLIGDKADDSEPLEAELAAVDVEMIAPDRRTRQRKTQNGRPLRRDTRRWTTERTIAW